MRVLKIVSSSFPNLPMYVENLRDVEDGLEVMLGTSDVWPDIVDDEQIIITFAEMSKEEFDALEEWAV